jgi:hypothetical protein
MRPLIVEMLDTLADYEPSLHDLIPLGEFAHSLHTEEPDGAGMYLLSATYELYSAHIFYLRNKVQKSLGPEFALKAEDYNVLGPWIDRIIAMNLPVHAAQMVALALEISVRSPQEAKAVSRIKDLIDEHYDLVAC